MPRHDPTEVLNRLVTKLKSRKRVRDIRGEFLSPRAEAGGGSMSPRTEGYDRWVNTTKGLGQTWCLRKDQLSHLFHRSLVAARDDRHPAFTPAWWFDEETALFAVPCAGSERVMHLVWRVGDDYFDRKLSADEGLELSLRCQKVFIQRLRIVAAGFGGW